MIRFVRALLSFREDAPKSKAEGLGNVQKGTGDNTHYGMDSVHMQRAISAPRAKAEGLGNVQKGTGEKPAAAPVFGADPNAAPAHQPAHHEPAPAHHEPAQDASYGGGYEEQQGGYEEGYEEGYEQGGYEEGGYEEGYEEGGYEESYEQ